MKEFGAKICCKMSAMRTDISLYIFKDFSGVIFSVHFILQITDYQLKAANSVTMNIFLFKSFVKVELSYVITIEMFSTAENCMEK